MNGGSAGTSYATPATVSVPADEIELERVAGPRRVDGLGADDDRQAEVDAVALEDAGKAAPDEERMPDALIACGTCSREEPQPKLAPTTSAVVAAELGRGATGRGPRTGTAVICATSVMFRYWPGKSTSVSTSSCADHDRVGRRGSRRHALEHIRRIDDLAGDGGGGRDPGVRQVDLGLARAHPAAEVAVRRRERALARGKDRRCCRRSRRRRWESRPWRRPRRRRRSAPPRAPAGRPSGRPARRSRGCSGAPSGRAAAPPPGAGR